MPELRELRFASQGPNPTLGWGFGPFPYGRGYPGGAHVSAPEAGRFRPVPISPPASARLSAMADAGDQPLDQQLEDIGTQLAWVRDYL